MVDDTVTPFPKAPKRPKPEAVVLPFPIPEFLVEVDADWGTAVECLEEVIRDIKCGKVAPNMLYVAMHQSSPDPEGVLMSTFPSYSWADRAPDYTLSVVETVGLLGVHQTYVVD